jgi:hypothetical protein
LRLFSEQRLKKFLGALGAALPILLCDLVGIAGAAAIAYGAWQIYGPAGWIAGGAMAVGGAWLIARAGA